MHSADTHAAWWRNNLASTTKAPFDVAHFVKSYHSAESYRCAGSLWWLDPLKSVTPERILSPTKLERLHESNQLRLQLNLWLAWS